MKNNVIDPGRLNILLNELRLPATKLMWPQFTEQADKEGWPAARFLAALAEHELAERDRRRVERHLAEGRLLPGKTLDTFEFEAVPMMSKAQVMAIVAGDTWLEKGANLLLFGGQGAGKSHLAAAIGRGLVENGWRVLYTRTTDLVQRLHREGEVLSSEHVETGTRLRALVQPALFEDGAELVVGCFGLRAQLQDQEGLHGQRLPRKG